MAHLASGRRNLSGSEPASRHIGAAYCRPETRSNRLIEHCWTRRSGTCRAGRAAAGRGLRNPPTRPPSAAGASALRPYLFLRPPPGRRCTIKTENAPCSLTLFISIIIHKRSLAKEEPLFAMKLLNRIAVVTGAASGIGGRAAWASGGRRGEALPDGRNPDGLEATRSEILASGGGPSPVLRCFRQSRRQGGGYAEPWTLTAASTSWSTSRACRSPSCWPRPRRITTK